MRALSATDVTGLIGHLSYAGIFVWFLVTQLVIVMPIPEEAVLLSIGYVSATGVWNPILAAAIALATLLLADAVFFSLSRSGNRWVARLVKRSEGGAFARAEARMKRSMPRAVFTLTFIPRLRFFGPVLAGALKIAWSAFFLADATALEIYTALYVSLGFFFHGRLHALFAHATAHQDVIVVIAVIAAGAIVGIVAARRWARGRDRDRPAAT